MTNNKNNNKKNIVVKTGVALCLVASITLSTVSIVQINQTRDLVRRTLDEKKIKTTEDDVVINTNYKIISTDAISDAYKSGDDSKLSEKDKETLELAKSVLDEIITKDMTDFEKEKAVYDWMVKNIRPDSGAFTVIPSAGQGTDAPHNVLKSKRAVCVGYATTFRLFMDMMDIPCMVVHNNENIHAWNLVQIDGQWYHTDVYGDGETGDYSHFNVSDEMLTTNGEWDKDFFPEANSMQYNMSYINAQKADSIYEIPKKIREAMDEKKPMVSLLFKDGVSDEDQIITGRMLKALSDSLLTNEKYANFFIDGTWNEAEGGNMLVVKLQDVTIPTEEEEDIPSELKNKINSVLGESFGDIGVTDFFADSFYGMEDDSVTQ